jgi:hypothetical protein
VARERRKLFAALPPRGGAERDVAGARSWSGSVGSGSTTADDVRALRRRR